MSLDNNDVEKLLAGNQGGYRDIDNVFSWLGAAEIVMRHEGIKAKRPESFAIDPRTGARVVYSPARMNRPEGYEERTGTGKTAICPLCDRRKPVIERTTPVIAIRSLPSGFRAFVNENLFAFLSPNGIPNVLDAAELLYGGHFLVWPTNEHADIHEISYEDHAVSFRLLGDLEKGLLESEGVESWHVQVIKNTGRAVGGSLEHGHYQVGFLSILPQKIEDDKRFQEKYKKSFVEYLLEKNPSDLKIKDYGSVITVTPYFMRRPLEVMVLPKNTSVSSLRDLSGQECLDFARATSDIAYSLYLLMPAMKKEFAYNFVFHTGPVGVMYIEVMPYTQEDGGFERAGLNVCQSSPEISAEIYKACFKAYVGYHQEKEFKVEQITPELLRSVRDRCITPVLKEYRIIQ